MRHKSRYRDEAAEYEEDELRREEENEEIQQETRSSPSPFSSRGRRGRGGQNGFVLKEVDVSQIPSDLLTNLTQLKPQDGGILLPENVEADGDAWILQCPKHVELQGLLKGRKIHLNGNPTLLTTADDDEESEVPHKTFESIAHSRQDSGESVSLLMPDLDGHFKLVSVPLKGYIMIREHVEELAPPDIKIPRRRLHKLPSGIKERHPVYGVDFSHASCLTKVTSSPRKHRNLQPQRQSIPEYLKGPTIRFSDAINTKPKANGKQHQKIIKEEPLWEEEVPTPKKTKKSKKRKHQELEEEELEEVEEEVSPVKAKKSKKLKTEVFEEEVFYNPEPSGNDTPHKSKKSKKSKSRERVF